eukprot:6192611-Pleurochrysis_carterae.AAC.2
MTNRCWLAAQVVREGDGQARRDWEVACSIGTRLGASAAVYTCAGGGVCVCEWTVRSCRNDWPINQTGEASKQQMHRKKPSKRTQES